MIFRFNSAIDSIWKFEQRWLGKNWIVLSLIISNFIGALVGFNYYITIIGVTSDFPAILWILIPDCPMSVFLLVGFYLQRDNQCFLNYDFFVFIQGIRSAIFTYLIVMNFPTIDVEIVIIGHTLLLIQAMLILPHLRNMIISKNTFLVIFLTLFNDYMDFFGLFSVFPPTLAQIPTIKPMFFVFAFLIIGLDILLITVGLGFRYLYQSNKKLTNLVPSV
ncbi:MAG: DUF1405 domain-containing protein [Candidatus Hodarchaeales archaeon]|jgi:hypothetical protein